MFYCQDETNHLTELDASRIYQRRKWLSKIVSIVPVFIVSMALKARWTMRSTMALSKFIEALFIILKPSSTDLANYSRNKKEYAAMTAAAITAAAMTAAAVTADVAAAPPTAAMAAVVATAPVHDNRPCA